MHDNIVVQYSYRDTELYSFCVMSQAEFDYLFENKVAEKIGEIRE